MVEAWAPRATEVCGGVCSPLILSVLDVGEEVDRSDGFNQHIPTMTDWVEVWGSQQPKSTPQSLCSASQTTPEAFLLRVREDYREGSRSRWGKAFAWKRELGLQRCHSPQAGRGAPAGALSPAAAAAAAGVEPPPASPHPVG